MRNCVSERRLCLKKRRRERYAIRDGVVLVAGLEPARYCYRGILSPLCLPVPPHQLIKGKGYYSMEKGKKQESIFLHWHAAVEKTLYRRMPLFTLLFPKRQRL